jgi:hypothetical protein
LDVQESFIDPKDGALCIITQYCSGGDLFTAIRRRAAGATAAVAGRRRSKADEQAEGGAAPAAGPALQEAPPAAATTGKEGSVTSSATGSAASGGSSSSAASVGSGAPGGDPGAQGPGPQYFTEDEVMDLFLQVGCGNCGYSCAHPSTNSCTSQLAGCEVGTGTA